MTSTPSPKLNLLSWDFAQKGSGKQAQRVTRKQVKSNQEEEEGVLGKNENYPTERGEASGKAAAG